MPIVYDIYTPRRAPVTVTRLYLPGASGGVMATTDPAITVEPPYSSESTEKERFSHANIAAYNPLSEPLNAVASVCGIGHIYVGAQSATYNYRYYFALGTSASATSPPSTWTEVTAMSYSRGAASTAGWYDEPAFGSVCIEATVPPKSYLWVRLRGTSWGQASSIGYKTANILILVLI